jgi:hypothetical protein
MWISVREKQSLAALVAASFRKFTFAKPVRHAIALQSLAPRAVRGQRSVTDRLSVHRNRGDTPKTPVRNEIFVSLRS